jgi:hypothetical protein
MISSLAKKIITWSAKWLDDTVPVVELHNFLKNNYKRMIDQIEIEGDRHFPLEVITDLITIHKLITASGLFPDWPTGSLKFGAEDEISRDYFSAWLAGLPGGRIIIGKAIVAGAGRNLDLLDEEDDPQLRGFLTLSLEGLLRHVEVKRRDCLSEFYPPLRAEEFWLQRHDISILFSRHARRRGDLRMLNAAFKLNDWAYPHYCRNALRAPLARYLLALTEQEIAAKELMV